MNNLENFKNLGLSDKTIEILAQKGFEEPTEIQSQSIPVLLNKNCDFLGLAQTGTGKTAAFGLPIIEQIDKTDKSIQALIITPTRELAIQVSEELNSFKHERDIFITAVYGGQSISLQERKLNKGIHILVGTPGRLLHHIRNKKLFLEDLKFLVLDEADEMLNMGFIEDIEDIMKSTPESKRTFLFSATMPPKIKDLITNYMHEFEEAKIKKESITTDLTEQIYFEVRKNDKFEALTRIIDIEPEFYGIIFCRTRNDVDEINQNLLDRGYDSEALHGDISQNQREKIFKKFKNKNVNILVATDVAARGIDVSNITHVINYSLPQDPESYVHRIGRTGRAGNEGTAITFVTPSEYQKLKMISRVANTNIKKEKVPGVEEIINVKKDNIIKEILSIMEESSEKSYDDIIDKLKEDYTEIEIIKALLHLNYKDDLDDSSYNDIKDLYDSKPKREREVSPDNDGKTRLFIALGKKDNMTKKDLVNFVMKKTNVKNHLIDQVELYENFSFITVPFKEAEIILDTFKKETSKGNKLLIEKAKSGKGSSKGSGSRNSSGSRRNYSSNKPDNRKGRSNSTNRKSTRKDSSK